MIRFFCYEEKLTLKKNRFFFMKQYTATSIEIRSIVSVSNILKNLNKIDQFNTLTLSYIPNT